MTKSEELTQRKSYPTGLDSTMEYGQALRHNQLDPNRKAVAETKRRIEITVEKHRLVVLSGRNHSTNSWCRPCGMQVQMVTPDQAAQLCKVSTRAIYGLIENESLHFTETENGFSLICLQSIESITASWTQEGREETVSKTARGLFRKSLMKRMLKRR